MTTYSRGIGVALLCVFVVMAGCTGGGGADPTTEPEANANEGNVTNGGNDTHDSGVDDGSNDNTPESETDGADGGDGDDDRANLNDLFAVEVIFGGEGHEAYPTDGIVLMNDNEGQSIDITGITIEAEEQRTIVDRVTVIEPTFDRTVLFDERTFDRENGGTITVYDADGNVLLETEYGPRESSNGENRDTTSSTADEQYAITHG